MGMKDGSKQFHQSPRGGGQDPGLAARIAALEVELARLRVVERDKAALEESLAQLREANQHLVLATVNAQSLRDDAQAAHRRQTEFLAMLAHELRNPLAPVAMAASLLARLPGAGARQLDLSRVIGRQVGHMAHLLDDLLDAARISSGKISLSLEPVALADVIAQAVETIQPRIRERAQSLAVDLPAAPAVLHGDRVRLAQVFTNVLANASKYTQDAGAIRIGAALRDGMAVVEIADNGSGIGAHELPYLFDLFTQGPRSLARSEGGLGVGLNVVRNLVAMHGGQVAAASPGPGQGSTFVIELPLSQLPLAAAPAPGRAPVPARPLKVLVVEDNVDACDTLQAVLEQEGHAVQACYDGHSGLAAALAGGFDLLVCDIGLPGLDGLALVSRLRQSGANGCVAIALSGYCQAEDRGRALAAGFDHYLIKPVSAESLLALIGAEPAFGR